MGAAAAKAKPAPEGQKAGPEANCTLLRNKINAPARKSQDKRVLKPLGFELSWHGLCVGSPKARMWPNFCKGGLRQLLCEVERRFRIPGHLAQRIHQAVPALKKRRKSASFDGLKS